MDANEISRAMFLEVLRSTHERLGSSERVAALLGVADRSVRHWLHETCGPSHPHMVRLYKRLVEAEGMVPQA
jgi:hypothetical protein